MEDKNISEKESNFQYPKKIFKKEKFEIVLVGSNFLILKDEKGTNIRVKCPSPSFSIGEKIYKEDGNFSWERA